MGTTTIDLERLTFNRTTLETKVWARRTDDPEWNPVADKPLKTYTTATIPRDVFDTLPCHAQILIVQDLQRRGIGWHKEQGSWRKYRIAADRSHTRVNLPPRPTTRARGAGRPAGRGASRRSSARSGDSGDDSDSPSDSSEPAPRRLCAFCGNDIPADRSAKATHCSDRHADRDRKRRQRQRDRERSQLPPTPTTADFRRMLEITDEERDWLRALVECRCNGRHQEFDPGECFRCGHRLPREQVAA